MRKQEQEYANRRQRSAAKKNPKAIIRRGNAPIDEGALRGKVVKAALVSEREKRDNAKRSEQMSTLISQLPPNARRVRIG